MTKSAVGSATLSQLAAELHKSVARFDKALQEIDRLHDVNREAGLAEWLSRNLLLVVRWLGTGAEASAHFCQSSPWLERSDVRSLNELPVMVAQLVQHLRPVLASDQLHDCFTKKRPDLLPTRVSTCVDAFTRYRTTLDLAAYRVVLALFRIRQQHLTRLVAASPADRALIHGDLPVSSLWARPPAASGNLQHLEIPCTHTLEPLRGVSEGPLRLCVFSQVGCGDALDVEEEQWESFTARVCVSVGAGAAAAYEGLELTVSSLSPGCEVQAVRTTLGEYDEEVWGDNTVRLSLPGVLPGHQHDLLVLGNIRSVGLVEIVFHVGAAPWVSDDHRRLRHALASAAGVEPELLRFAEVGAVAEDGTAGVLCAFPDHAKPRAAQATLLDLLAECTSPGDCGLPHAVKFFGAAQPTTPDLGCQVKFRFQSQNGLSPQHRGAGRAVMFSETKDVGDTLTVDVCLAERCGMHSARVREEVFRQNLCALLEHASSEASAENDPGRWKRELAKTLTSPLYDHPLSELRQTPVVRELLWVALGDEVDTHDCSEREAIIASLRAQENVPNCNPLNPRAAARHSLFRSEGGVGASLHEGCVAINDELQRMCTFLDVAGGDLQSKELLSEEEQERGFLLASEDEGRASIAKHTSKMLSHRSSGAGSTGAGGTTSTKKPARRSTASRTSNSEILSPPTPRTTRTPAKHATPRKHHHATSSASANGASERRSRKTASPSPMRSTTPIWQRYGPPPHQQRHEARAAAPAAQPQHRGRSRSAGEPVLRTASRTRPVRLSTEEAVSNRMARTLSRGSRASSHARSSSVRSTTPRGEKRRGITRGVSPAAAHRAEASLDEAFLPHRRGGSRSSNLAGLRPTQTRLERLATASPDKLREVSSGGRPASTSPARSGGRHSAASPSPSHSLSHASEPYSLTAAGSATALRTNSITPPQGVSPRRRYKENTSASSLSMVDTSASPHSQVERGGSSVSAAWHSRTPSPEAWTHPQMSTGGSSLASASPRRRTHFRLSGRVCVRPGVEAVRDVFAETGTEWKDTYEKYVGCRGYVAEVDPMGWVKIQFDPSYIASHGATCTHISWPVEAVEHVATSPVPVRASLCSDPAPAVRYGTIKLSQARRAAKLASLYASPVAALVAVLCAMTEGEAEPKKAYSPYGFAQRIAARDDAQTSTPFFRKI